MIIALEEHYEDEELAKRMDLPVSGVTPRLRDLGAERQKDMEAAGIDFQVLSHAPPGVQRIPSSEAAMIARAVNDRLASVVRSRPDRFAAFATLPMTAPQDAVAELQRSVTELGMKGAMIHGPTDGVFIDDGRFWPVLEAAQALDVPLYIHPADPMDAVREAYFSTYEKSHPTFLRSAWGFTIETGTAAIRLILSGVFERYPDLKIILGHMGEGIPFFMSRIDESLSRSNPETRFRETFRRNFYITTSGFFSDSALACCLAELGADRILFSVDWPYVSNMAATEWFRQTEISPADREKIAHGNARTLLKLGPLPHVSG